MRKEPCYKFPDRTPTCHGSCDTYLTWQKANEKRREAEKAFKRMDYALSTLKKGGKKR